MAQEGVGEDAGYHRFADRHGANADARVVATLGDDLALGAGAVDGLARRENRRRRFDGETRDDRLTRRYAAQYAAGIVGQEHRTPVVAGAHFVGVLFAGQFGGGKARANFHALDRVDAHQRARDLGVELAVDRRAPAGWRAFRDDLEHRADRRSGFANPIEIVGEALRGCRVRAKERIAMNFAPVPTRAIDLMRADLNERAANRHSGNDLARDRAGGDSHRGLSRRRPAAPAIVAQAIFGLVGEIGVARTALVFDLAIVLGALIDVLDQEPDRRSGGHRP